PTLFRSSSSTYSSKSASEWDLSQLPSQSVWRDHAVGQDRWLHRRRCDLSQVLRWLLEESFGCQADDCGSTPRSRCTSRWNCTHQGSWLLAGIYGALRRNHQWRDCCSCGRLLGEQDCQGFSDSAARRRWYGGFVPPRDHRRSPQKECTWLRRAGLWPGCKI